MAGFNMGGLSDLTKKQVDMSFARSPLNNQELNLSSMERKKKPTGVLTDSEAAKAEKQTGKGTSQGVTGQVAAGATPMQGMAGNLGSFSTGIAAAVNEFLAGGGATDISAQMVGGFAPVFRDGKWVAGTGDQTMEVGAGQLAGIKSEELGGLREQLSPYMVDGRFKKFEDVVEKFGDTNQDGVISPEEQAEINRAFNIINQIRRLNTLRAGPEREALMMQLQSQDRDGLVSGIMEAMDTYDEMAGDGKGFNISGSGAKEFQVGDLLTMGTEDLAKEIEAAAFGRDSLFSGQMASEVRRKVDKSQEAYRLAGKEQEKVQNEIKRVADEWISGYQDRLTENRAKINETFLGAVQDIVADLDKVAAAEGNPAWVQRAKQWFIDTSKGNEEEGTDFASVMMAMVSGEFGLQPEVRAMFEKYLDQTLGGGEGQAALARSLNSLATKGYLETMNESGEMVRVPLTMNDKLYVSSIMADPNIVSMEKQAKIQALIDARTGSFGADLQTNSKLIGDLISSGELATATQTFRESLVTSLTTYKDSFTDMLYEKATSEGAADGNIAESMDQSAREYLDTLNRQAETARKELDKKAADVERDTQEISELIKAVGGQVAKGAEIIKGNYTKAIQGSIPQYTEAVSKYLAAIGQPAEPSTVQRYAELYSYLRTMYNLKRHGKGPAGNLYQQVYGYFDKLPVSGKYFENLVMNPTKLFSLQQHELDALQSSMFSQDFSQSFQQSEQFNALTDLGNRLNTNLDAAGKAKVDIISANREVDRLIALAGKDLATFSKDSADRMFQLAKQGQVMDLGDRSGVSAGDIDMSHGNILWVEDAHGAGDVTDVSGVGDGISSSDDRKGIDDILKQVAPAEQKTRKSAAVAMHAQAARDVAADFSKKTGREFVAEYVPERNVYVVTDKATGRKVSINPNPYIDIVSSSDDVMNVRNYVTMLVNKDGKDANWLQKAANYVRGLLTGEIQPGPLESAHYDKIIGQARQIMDEGRFDQSVVSGAAYLSPADLQKALTVFSPQPPKSSKGAKSPTQMDQVTATPTGFQSSVATSGQDPRKGGFTGVQNL
jgi:hypothetical protein